MIKDIIFGKDDIYSRLESFRKAKVYFNIPFTNVVRVIITDAMSIFEDLMGELEGSAR